VIKFVSDLRQVDGFIPVSSTNKTDPHVIKQPDYEPTNKQETSIKQPDYEPTN
jgi:hypothetical protein